ncbi:glycoside hydrolase family 3 N-terminal domain-containing protein [Enterococcus pseudoavium]|uniref:beta-N-acetylhexosaminidase n=2 Tax=Enterococcus pseudoavium TaxID=44007 RepID=A0ABU3FK66_9ENTE|nr:glycoside hydrolase family 3 N-terminal domain-containing protein [Enterococcus pseudoavium]MDT2753553.1 glycoside hydrolase family 3 N-terminal domain-containing protein [Enterococcus pseudoavium]MDT2771466.1 glycoside hydrolase family 3 N-terminal domain-containing protein [Enterococcus pseudoavium]
MKKRMLVSLIFLSAMVILTACGSSSNKAKNTSEDTKTSDSSKKETQSTKGKIDLTAKEKADKIMGKMTLEEKVGQLFLVRVPEQNQVEDIKNYHLGGYLLFDRDMEGKGQSEIKQTIASYQAASKTPMFIGSDEEGGTVSRLSRNQIVSPAFESPQTSYQKDGWEGITQEIDRKAQVFKELGIQLGMFPDADVSTDPQSFIYDRTIGMDAAGTSQYVKLSVEEMKKQKIGSTLKHFPGYGNNRDSHVEIVTDERSIDELRKNDFLPFEVGIKAGADSIMVSHNVVQAIDGDRPASISKPVHDVIRNELGFEGVVMTDDMDMAGLADFISQEEAGLQALQAGNDLILSSSYSSQIPFILDAIKKGEYSEKQLNQSVERLLIWKAELGLI